MKKIFKLLSFLAIASIFAVSCKKEAQYTPGEEDITGCYGVYFPAQTLPTILDPTQDPVVNITVKRKNSTGDIIVPVEVQGDEVFELAPILFADGQDETTVKLFFDKAELGVNYKVSIGVTDPKFASKYASNPASIDYSVLRVSYYYFGCKNGKETKEVDPANATKVSWYSPFWGEYFTGIIKYYETNGLRTCVTVTDPERFDIAKQAWYNTGKGFFGTTGDEFEFLWDTKTKKLYYEPCPVWNHATYGMIYMADYYGWYVGLTGKISISGPIEFYTEYKENFKDFMSEYDGNGGFNFFVCGYSWKGTTGSGFAFPEDIDLFGVADGFIRVDYSIEAEAGLTQDGVTPVAFTTGADVAKVVYANYEGVLSATQISNAVTAIVEGKVPSAQSVVPEEGEAAVGVTLDATGVYTLVAVSYDKDNNAQESTSTTFTYVSPTDPVPVVISTGLGSAEKYREVSTDTALELYIFGDDIVDAKCTLIDEPTVISKGVDACISKLLATKSLSATAIEAINGDGYVGVATGLLPGTKYYSFVWASNGFEENVFISDPYSTTGEPKPIYKNFTADDLKNLPETSDKYFGTYNYYAVDYNDENGNTLRQYLGKVTISDSDIPDSGPDEEGLIDE
ncbi:MAG: hypothetical protein HUJ95_02420, partial [Bacteroidales bacterium]|nr:hypothetical protein [Bacteroidales bacterium]